MMATPPFFPEMAEATSNNNNNGDGATYTSPSGIGVGGVNGEGDRAFKLGDELEKNGLMRASAAAFHEAATLYQCYLDAEDGAEFQHVTTLTNVNDCKKALAHICVRLAHLSHDALGDPKAAVRLFKDSTTIDPEPSPLEFDGMGTAIEASTPGDLSKAVEAYKKALDLSPSDGEIFFHMAVALERLGREEESEVIMEQLRRSEAVYACLVDSWGYLRWHTRKYSNTKLNLYRGTRDMLQIALDAALPMIQHQNGLVCEFGVGSGRSIRMIQEMLPLDIPIQGFDTFLGWSSPPSKGAIPSLESSNSVSFYRGLFEETLPAFLKQVSSEEEKDDQFRPLAFANIDCELYGSTLDILENLYSRIVPGTVLIFDEYICHPTWRQDEFRAW
eukprot:CAMPEP_0178949842 /NCGR_PEP_ID=MMETSP0789-20121207/6297_1 /TAXON_ID=3005 /ORGANISM="Rhizosolenia setigera, Strain CCMP 1694" /LENGTH=387 /DNA_ID=CAMNT_0020630453 /DNA_START=178 /DNA_END=1338 /DNA_ORIENTATION=+